jgi:3D (Asp-Asp-Asp) domain-containing protein
VIQAKEIGLIGRGPVKASHLLAIGVLTAGLVTAGFLTHPASAWASAGANVSAQHVVSFESNGTTAQHVTTATTVGAFLAERGIVVNANDYVHPSVDEPLSDRLIVEYRAAVPVTIVSASRTLKLDSSAVDVGALLEEQHITLGKNDEVHPSLADRIVSNTTVRIVRVTNWTTSEREAIAVQTVHKIVLSLSPGQTKVLSRGRSGLRETMVRFTQRDNGGVAKHVIRSRVLRKPEPRVVAEGIGEYDAFMRFGQHGLDKTAYVAQSALQMVATAYTAGCYGCSGITATGQRAGHGIVAVDPRVIPLGTRLYIPGYGLAIAGDTGGAIRGSRIDLGFNSLSDALRFGRRTVTVYRLK